MSFGKTIRLYLADGSPTGLRHVEITNWTGQAVACPRSRLSEFSKWEETQRPGVYFLLAEGESQQKGRAYIGESENVLHRIASHEREKDFWNDVIAFTSKDENLTKAHIRYLEARLYDLASSAKRYELENGNVPQASGLPRSDRDAMEEFLVAIRMVLGALGFRLLEGISNPVEGASANDPAVSELKTQLTFEFKNLKAIGAQIDEGFVVYKGSEIDRDTQPSTTDSVKRLRENAIVSGQLADHESHYILSDDWLFTSSSQAASFCAGSNRNGRDAWKAPDGRSLKEIETSSLTISDL